MLNDLLMIAGVGGAAGGQQEARQRGSARTARLRSSRAPECGTAPAPGRSSRGASPARRRSRNAAADRPVPTPSRLTVVIGGSFISLSSRLPKPQTARCSGTAIALHPRLGHHAECQQVGTAEHRATLVQQRQQRAQPLAPGGDRAGRRQRLFQHHGAAERATACGEAAGAGRARGNRWRTARRSGYGPWRAGTPRPRRRPGRGRSRSPCRSAGSTRPRSRPPECAPRSASAAPPGCSPTR